MVYPEIKTRIEAYNYDTRLSECQLLWLKRLFVLWAYGQRFSSFLENCLRYRP